MSQPLCVTAQNIHTPLNNEELALLKSKYMTNPNWVSEHSGCQFLPEDNQLFVDFVKMSYLWVYESRGDLVHHNAIKLKRRNNQWMYQFNDSDKLHDCDINFNIALEQLYNQYLHDLMM